MWAEYSIFLNLRFPMSWHMVSARYKKIITNTSFSIAGSLLCHSAPADALSLPCPPENMQRSRPKVGPSDAWKNSAFRQCLYRQLEHLEQELLLLEPRGSSQGQNHTRALGQLQTLKGYLVAQAGTLPPAHSR